MTVNGLEILREAQDAERLLASALLQQVLGELREDAMGAALGGATFEAREQGRLSVLAIDGLQSKLRARVDAGRLQAHRDEAQSRPRPVPW